MIANLRWLLEGVLDLPASPRDLSRILLLSPIEFFGEVQARLGPEALAAVSNWLDSILSGEIPTLIESLNGWCPGGRSC